MNKGYHADLAGGRWFTMTLAEQLGNIGSEVNRSISSFEKNDKERMAKAIDRTLELFDLTLADRRWKDRLKEITRSRELFCSLFFDQKNYKDLKNQMDFLNEYFLQFAVLARAKR